MHYPDTLEGIEEFCASEGQATGALFELVAAARAVVVNGGPNNLIELRRILDRTDPSVFQPFPHTDGDTMVIGPECFASATGDVISWKGKNYVSQERIDGLTERLQDAVDRINHGVSLISGAMRR